MKQTSDGLLPQIMAQKYLCIVMCIPEFTQVKPVNPLIAGELSNPVRVKEKE